MEKPGDDPARWNFEINIPEGQVRVSVRDRVELVNDVPWHRGLEVQVDRPAPDIDAAVDAAIGDAETVLIMLAAAGRAPVGSVEPWVAYDITPGLAERDFVQWYYDVPIVVGKTPVKTAGFGKLWGALFIEGKGVSDQRLQWRVLQSMSLHRQALDETDPLTRFLILWLAFEGVGPLLADHYEVDPSGFGGLRALADEVLGDPAGSDLITKALGLRRELFHALRMVVPEAKERASELSRTSRCLSYVRGLIVLDQPFEADDFPATSVVPFRPHMRVRATLLHEDETTWGPDMHPHLEGRLTPIRVPGPDPRDITLTFETSLTVRNADQVQPRRVEIHGPSGPSVGRFEMKGDGAE